MEGLECKNCKNVIAISFENWSDKVEAATEKAKAKVLEERVTALEKQNAMLLDKMMELF